MSGTLQVARETLDLCWAGWLKKVPNIQIVQRISDKYKKTVAHLPKSFGDEAVVSSSSEYDANKKEGSSRFKIEQSILLLPWTKLWIH